MGPERKKLNTAATASFNRILLISLGGIGDLLFVTPLAKSLRRAYPEAIIDVLGRDGRVGILQGNPDLNRVLSIAGHPSGRQYLTLFRKLFRRYELAISTRTSDRHLAYAILAARHRVMVVKPFRWSNAWKRILAQAWLKPDSKAHIVAHISQLADLLNIERSYDIVVPYSPNSPRHLDGVLPFNWQNERYAVLHPFPRNPYKRWSVAGWRNTIEFLLDQGLKVVLTGGPDKSERKYLDSIARGMPFSVTNSGGVLAFCDIALLTSHCTVFMGVDTATTHMAAATGAPTVAIYGPTNPLKYAPWPYRYHSDIPPYVLKGTQRVGNVLLVQPNMPCVPCAQEGCERDAQKPSDCLIQLDSRSVIEALKGFINLAIPICAQGS